METTSKSSGLLTIDSLITSTGKSILTDIIINTDGTNDATLTLVDAVSAATIFKATVVGSDNTGVFNNFNTRADGGLFATITGTGADYIVHFK